MLLDEFKSARLKSVPLVGIETPDPAATIETIVKAPCLNDEKTPTPFIQWDLVRGLTSLNTAGKTVLTKINTDAEELRAKSQNPTEALILASTFPDKTILFFHNAHRWLENESIAQAVWLLRDLFKANERMLVLLAPSLRFPSELERDIIVLDEALPDDTARREIILGLHKDAGIDPPKADVLKKVVEASRGLAAFPTEQVVAMAMQKEGIVVKEVWERKRKMIEQARGLTMFKGTETFANVGGIEAAKTFATDLFNGNKPPTCIVFLDELEKSMAGATGDTSGTSQDQHGQILSFMDLYELSGMLTVGPPGCTKSMFAKTMAATFGVPCLALDLGALKGSLVGQSEHQIRACLKTIAAIAEGGAFFVATCNRLANLAPELRRRFRAGIWMFPLPDEEERSAIWTLQMKRYGLDQKQGLPNAEEWTGADIRNCCELAWQLRRPVVETEKLVVPVSKSDPDSIKQLYALANGRFLCASYEGAFDQNRRPAKGGKRAISLN